MRISTTMLHRQGVTSILDQQARLAELQNQLARGQRLVQGADDPAGIGEAVRLDDALAVLQRDRSDISTLRRRLNVEESTLDSVTDNLQRIRDLTVAGVNGTQSVESRGQIASEVRERLNELVSLANAQDGTGRYLFAGTRDGQPPFAVSGSAVIYSGDEGVRKIGIAPSRDVADGDSGSQVFMRIPDGNGSFKVSAAGNVGSATVTQAQVLDPVAWNGQPYTISFGAGSYNVTDAGGTSISSGSFTSGEPVEFAGLSIAIEGDPAAGDSFAIDPSRSQSLFATVSAIADALESGDDPASSALRHLDLQTALAELDQGLDHISTVRGGVGGRLSALDQAEAHHDAVAVELESALGNIRDLDYAEATSRLALQLAGLEAAQQSYLRVQNLSLFNYLR